MERIFDWYQVEIQALQQLSREDEVNCYLVGFQTSQSLSGIVMTPLGIAMIMSGAKGFRPLICNSLRSKLKPGKLQFVGEINHVEEKIRRPAGEVFPLGRTPQGFFFIPTQSGNVRMNLSLDCI